MQRTPLHPLHLEHGAKLVPFAGYEMPLNYPDGILAEHLHTREFAGLFDVSHMGQIDIRAKTATTAAAATATDIALALESLIPADLLSLPAGRQKYALLTNAQGGIIDDAMLQNLGERFVLVVNAACKQQDFDHLRRHLGDATRASFPLVMALSDDRALLALQGPAAAAVLAELGHDLDEMKFMAVREMEIAGAACVVARSGYTGEDGFELAMQAADAERVARALLSHPPVKLAGLGARDSLRLEAGLCLYGNDITADTTPAEAGLNWAVSKARRAGGERAGGFPGDHIVLAQAPPNAASVERVRVGLLPGGRAPVRAGAPLLDADSNAVGEVTSGGFAPSLGCPLSMGYVQPQHADVGAELHAEVRNKRLPVTVAALPFVASNFYR